MPPIVEITQRHARADSRPSRMHNDAGGLYFLASVIRGAKSKRPPGEGGLECDERPTR
jgi:hypothetical protein